MTITLETTKILKGKFSTESLTSTRIVRMTSKLLNASRKPDVVND